MAKYTLDTMRSTMPMLKILLIDDDPVFLNALEVMLVNEGHLPTLASNGQSGVDIFESALSDSPFDLVITDLAMPGVDGNRVAMAIKTLSPDTPIILLTGWQGDPDREALASRRVDRVLGKPVYMSKLREALKAVLPQSR